MVNKAEKVLEEILDLPNEIEIMTADGMPTGLKKIDPSLINQKRDVAKFIAEKLIKDYEKKPEVAVYQNVSILDIINKFEKKDGAEIRGQVLEAE